MCMFCQKLRDALLDATEQYIAVACCRKLSQVITHAYKQHSVIREVTVFAILCNLLNAIVLRAQIGRGMYLQHLWFE